MKRWIVAAAILLACWLPTAVAASPSPRPAWCQKGWACVPTEEIAADAEYHLDLREQINTYRARAKRFGWTVGPGIGAAGVVDENLDVHWVPTAGFFLIFGWRF